MPIRLLLLLTLTTLVTHTSTAQSRLALPQVGANDAGLFKCDQATQGKILQGYGKFPLSFEANQGQTDPHVKFLSRGPGYTLFLTSDEAVLSLRKSTEKGEYEIRCCPF